MKIEKEKSFNFRNYAKKMTIKQLEFLFNHVNSNYKSEVLSLLVNKVFGEDYKQATNDITRQTVMIKVYQFMKQRPSSIQMLVTVLIHLIELNLDNDDINVEYFKEYIRSPYCAVTREYGVNPIKEEYNVKYGLNFFPIRQNHEQVQIVKKFLSVAFFRNLVSFKEISEIIKPELFNLEYFKACVKRGDENEAAEKFLGSSNYEKMVQSSEITICDTNPTSFKVGEPVIIKADIKNISSLFIKIYEINTENYFYTKRTEVDSTMSLEGLAATFEYDYTFSDKPQIMKTRDFVLDKIGNRRGFYIVEFFGNGVSSRAVIKIGNLNILSRQTPKGILVYVLDENDNICGTFEKTGLWVKNDYYSANENGEILIPFMKTKEGIKVVVIHDGFADLKNLELLTEIYSISGNFILNHESILAGNKVNVLLKPSLKLNTLPIDPSSLKNSKITLIMEIIENEMKVPVTQVFENLEINKDSEFSFMFTVPPKLDKLSFKFESEIYNSSQETTNKLYLDSTFEFETKQEEDQFIKFFLRKIGPNFLLSLLGKNGEKKVNQLVDVEFEHIFLYNKEVQTLLTDENGQILLGNLNFINKITASSNYMERKIKQTFEVPRERSFSYPNNLNVLLGETITLPISLPSNDPTLSNFILNFNLVSSEEIISDEISCVKLVQSINDNQRLFIQITPKNVGSYKLFIKLANKKIQIEVHEGKYLNGNSEIIVTKNNKLIENYSNKNLICFENVSLKKIENSELTNVSIRINKTLSNARIHLFAYQFLYSDPHNLSNSMKYMMQAENPITRSIPSWNNIFLSNRLLNEEIQYVFDRKNLESSMGISLEKPSLLLKRQFNRTLLQTFRQ